MMLRNMLADRFKLVCIARKKEVSVLESMVSKGGPNLPLAGSDDSPAKGVSPIAQSIRRKVTEEFEKSCSRKLWPYS